MPPADDLEDFNQRKERHFWRNAALVTPVDLFWGFAMALIALGPIFTVLLRRLGATDLIIGLAPAVSLVGGTLLQLPAAHLTRNLRRTKVFFTFSHYGPCALWIVAGLVVPRLAQAHPQDLIWFLLAALTLFSMGIGFVLPMWTQLWSRLFTDRDRGLVSGLVTVAAGVGGLAGGYYATYVLARRAFPGNYAHLFLVAGSVGCLAVLGYLFVHEVLPSQPEPEAPTGLLRSLGSWWRADRRLRRFLLVRNVFEFGTGATAFFAVYALRRFSLPDSTGGGFVIASCLGSAVLGLWLGSLGGQRGFRRVMSLSMAGTAAATLIALGGKNPRLFYVVFLLAGAGASGDWMASVNLLIEMSAESSTIYYYALYNTVLTPVRLVAPLFWGWLGDVAGLQWAFLFGFVLQALGLIALLALVDDPRRPDQRLLRWRWGTWRPWLY